MILDSGRSSQQLLDKPITGRIISILSSPHPVLENGRSSIHHDGFVLLNKEEINIDISL